jgi:hypothetical protein
MELLITSGLVIAAQYIGKNADAMPDDSKKKIFDKVSGVNPTNQQNYSRAVKQEEEVVNKAFNDMKKGKRFASLNSDNVFEGGNSQSIDELNENKVDEDYVYSQLTGEYVPKKSFKHNNMEPFFSNSTYGESYKDNDQSSSKLGIFTGSEKLRLSKADKPINGSSQTPLFKPCDNMTSTWGQQNTLEKRQEYYNPSMYRTSETSVEPTYVGPGLNKGYTAKPSGGFHQDNSRDFMMPKTVDELRAGTNPKLTYEGRTKHGGGPTQRGKIGAVGKYNPSTFYINTPDRYFTTATEVKRGTMRPKCIILPKTNRTKSEYQVGPARYITDREPKRGLARKSHKITFMGDNIRNVRTEDILDTDNELSGYGKSGFNLPANERDVTGTRGSVRNLGSIFKKETYYNPEDIMKTTIKETTIHDEREGNVQYQNTHTGAYTVHPNYVKTTIKETLLSDYTGDPNSDQLGGGGGYMTAPLDIRYTNRENISIGRPPTQEKNKLSVGSDKINVIVDKLDNDRIVTREPQTTKVYNSIEQAQFCGQTTQKDRLNDKQLMAERVNPDLLDAFKSNPYTKSLSSFAYS